ncbi:unnamed protein product [Caenorhabditis angaria]|uniref:Uncharacterized protein n=1 Tax=Caenorhabditis angaria TaxID=860376 RepID=A0A9P1N4T8_9PELO|nr:unnamed protein product [Caenorhabditis angaria]
MSFFHLSPFLCFFVCFVSGTTTTVSICFSSAFAVKSPPQIASSSVADPGDFVLKGFSSSSTVSCNLHKIAAVKLTSTHIIAINSSPHLQSLFNTFNAEQPQIIVVFRSRQVELEMEDFCTAYRISIAIRVTRSNQCDVSSWQRRLQQHLPQSPQRQRLPKRFRLRKLLLFHHLAASTSTTSSTISTTTALAETVPTPKADVAPPREQKCQVFAELPHLSLLESSPANFAIASAKLTAPLQYIVNGCCTSTAKQLVGLYNECFLKLSVQCQAADRESHPDEVEQPPSVASDGSVTRKMTTSPVWPRSSTTRTEDEDKCIVYLFQIFIN